jgi:hypothetical protein
MKKIKELLKKTWAVLDGNKAWLLTTVEAGILQFGDKIMSSDTKKISLWAVGLLMIIAGVQRILPEKLGGKNSFSPDKGH